MAYEKTNWENFVTPLDQINMNHIEDGIAELDESLSRTQINVKQVTDGLETTNQNVTANSQRLTALQNKHNEDIASVEAKLENSSETLTNEVNSKLPKQNIDILKDVSIAVEGDQAFITKTVVNLNQDTLTPTVQQSTEIIPDATENRSGLMTSSTVKAITEMQEHINQLQNKTTRLLYDTKTDPTAEDINSFVVGLGYISPFEGIAVVVDETFHIWHYYENDGWKDDGLDTVTNFTNEIPGIIQGSTEDGKVFANADGTGSINGWDTVKENINSAIAKINNAVDLTSAQTIEGVKTLTSNLNFSPMINITRDKAVSYNDYGIFIGKWNTTNDDKSRNIVILSNEYAGTMGYQNTLIGKDIYSAMNANGNIGLGTSIRFQDSYGIVIGRSNSFSSLPTRYTITGNYGIAIGINAFYKADNAIQLGTGTNSTAKTLQVFDYQLLDGNTGLIPEARLAFNITDYLTKEVFANSALKLPDTAPDTTVVPTIDNTNTQQNIALDNFVLTTAQNFTAEQKAQVRGNLGLPATAFDGSYLSLGNKPILNTDNSESLAVNSAEEINAIVNLHKISKTGALADAIQDENNRTVTDAEKAAWNDKLDKAGGTMSGNINMNNNNLTGVNGLISYNGTYLLDSTSTGLVNVGNAEESLVLYGKDTNVIYNGKSLAFAADSFKQYDLIISTQAEFENFYATLDNETCTAKSVLFVGNGGTASFLRSDGKGLHLPSTLKVVAGINSASIRITNFDGTSLAGIYYTSKPTDINYSLSTLSVTVISNSVNSICLQKCINISNCILKAYQYSSRTARAVSYCKNISHCDILAECRANENGIVAGTSYGIYESDYAVDCTVTARGADDTAGIEGGNFYFGCVVTVDALSTKGQAYGYQYAQYLYGCTATINSGHIISGFEMCYYLTACTSTLKATGSYNYDYSQCSYPVTCISTNSKAAKLYNNCFHVNATLDDIPENYVTTDTAQTITVDKTFTGAIVVPDVSII